MKIGWSIFWLIFSFNLLADEEGSFADNHLRFTVENLPRLVEQEGGNVLLIGAGGITADKLADRYSLNRFEELRLRNKHSWEKTATQGNWWGTFDCVVAFNILEREEQREKVLRFILDLLKPGGKALIYVDSKDPKAFDQRIEHYIRNSRWIECVPIIPSLSTCEFQRLMEGVGFHVLEQSDAEYKMYFRSDLYALLSAGGFACARWPVPRTTWDEEQFAGEIKGLLNSEFEVIKIPDACPVFNEWIEDVLPTYYFILRK